MPRTRELELTTYHRLPGEPVQNVSLIERAWHECVEMQVRPLEEYLTATLLTLASLDRLELIVTHGDVPVGAVVVAHDPWDSHVGDCVSVFAQYVLPEYRNRGISLMLMRESLQAAKDFGASVLAYTHRTAPWRYETTYKRIAP